MTQTYEIADDWKGTNKRRVTAGQYRAELDERAKYAAAIMAAVRAGDMKACAVAQKAMSEKFPH